MEGKATLAKSQAGPGVGPTASWQDWIEGHPAYGLAVLFLILGVFSLAVPIIPTNLVTEIMSFGLFAISFNLLLGYTGLLSFGHSTFLGLGSYATALFMLRTGIVDLWVALLVGIAVPSLAAVIIGWFALRRRQVYFAMLTLAFNQMVFFIFFQWRSLTNGDDGLRGIPVPNLELPGISIPMESLGHQTEFFFFVYVLVILSVLAVQRIVQSPFGRALQAIRESEERARAIGYDTNRLQLLSFIFSGLFAGLAGAINTLLYGFVALESLNWFMAGVVVMMTIVGGRGTFIGPFIGATVYLFVQEYAARLTENWPLIMGAIFVVIVLLLPQGVWGTFKTWYHNRRSLAEMKAAMLQQPAITESNVVDVRQES